LGDIRRTLTTVKIGIAEFKGVAAAGGSVNWIQPVNNSAVGWKLDPAGMAAQADLAARSMKAVYTSFFGPVPPTKVTVWADISLDKTGITSPEKASWVGALAKQGVHHQILIG
jgi:hypothetical protein